MSLNHFNGMYALMMKRNQGYVCTYAFNADASVITGFLGCDGRLTLSGGDQKGSYLTTGAGFLAGMAPSGVDTDTQQSFDPSVGKMAIEFAVTIPANSGTDVVVVSAAFGTVGETLYTNLDITAEVGGTFGIDLYTSAGVFVNHYTASGLLSAPLRAGIMTDGDASTIQLYLDGVAVTMANPSLPPNPNTYMAMFVQEFAGAQAALTYDIQAVTSASDMTGSYPSGTVDICGNPV